MTSPFQEKITKVYNALTNKINSSISTHNTSSSSHQDLRNSKISYGQVDSTSTSTVFTATVPNVNELTNGTTVMLRNGVVSSATGFTLNVNGLGAKPVYNNLVDATRDTTIFNINYTMLFVYDSTRVDGGCWICYRGYDSNTIGYQLRTNSTKYIATDKGYKYRLWLQTSEDGKFMPVNTSTSTDAIANRSTSMNNREFIIGGDIRYNGTDGTTNQNAEMNAYTMWQQFVFSLGYSFNNTGSALALSIGKPVYMVATPTSNGKARLTTPYYTQDLPNSVDGKIYILLGYMYSATYIEMTLGHPVFEYRNGSVGLYNPSYSINEMDTLLDEKADTEHTHTFGTTSGTFAQGNDSRLSDSRNPLFNQIPNNTTEKSLNTYRTGGFYYCNGNTYSKYIDNCPLAKANNNAFWLLVETWGVSNNNFVKQTLTYYNNNKTYIRVKQGDSDANLSWSDWVELSKDTVYTHPNGTAKTGNPDGNKTPAFGSTFTVTQFTSDSQGHITGATDRTVKIPNSTASTSANGLMTTTQVTDLTNLKNRYDGNYIGGVETVTKPYLRLFHLESKNSSSSSTHIIFEIIGNNNDRLYAKIRVDMRQNTVGANGSNSSYTVTPLEVYGFDLNQLYFGFYDNHVNNKTYLDIYRKVGSYVNFYIRIYDDHLRDGSYTMYKPVVNSTESYTDLSEASTSLYNTSYTSTSQGGTYGAVTNTLPYTNMTANSFVKRGGTATQLLLADGTTKATGDFATSGHNHGNINNNGTVTTTKTTSVQNPADYGSDYFLIRDVNDNNSTKSANIIDVLNKIVEDLIDEGES